MEYCLWMQRILCFLFWLNHITAAFFDNPEELLTGTVYVDGTLISKTIVTNTKPHECSQIAPTGSGEHYVRCCNLHKDDWHNYLWKPWISGRPAEALQYWRDKATDYDIKSTCDGFVTYSALKSPEDLLQGSSSSLLVQSMINGELLDIVGTITSVQPRVDKLVACKKPKGSFIQYPCRADTSYCLSLGSVIKSRDEAYSSYKSSHGNQEIPIEKYKIGMLSRMRGQCDLANWDLATSWDAKMSQHSQMECISMMKTESPWSIITNTGAETLTTITANPMLPHFLPTACFIFASSLRIYYPAKKRDKSHDICGLKYQKNSHVPWLYSGLDSYEFADSNNTLTLNTTGIHANQRFRVNNFIATGTRWLDKERITEPWERAHYRTVSRKALLFHRTLQLAKDKVYVHFDEIEMKWYGKTVAVLNGNITSSVTWGYVPQPEPTTYKTDFILTLESTAVSSIDHEQSYHRFRFEDLNFPFDLDMLSGWEQTVGDGEDNWVHGQRDLTEGEYRPYVLLPTELLQAHPDFTSCSVGYGGNM
jgi:hypothetical protein